MSMLNDDEYEQNENEKGYKAEQVPKILSRHVQCFNH